MKDQGSLKYGVLIFCVFLGTGLMVFSPQTRAQENSFNVVLMGGLPIRAEGTGGGKEKKGISTQIGLEYMSGSAIFKLRYVTLNRGYSDFPKSPNDKVSDLSLMLGAAFPKRSTTEQLFLSLLGGPGYVYSSSNGDENLGLSFDLNLNQPLHFGGIRLSLLGNYNESEPYLAVNAGIWIAVH